MRSLTVCTLLCLLAAAPAVAQEQALPLDIETQATPTPATITGSHVNFRAGPGTDQPVVGQFGDGLHRVELIRREGDWAQIAMPSSQGTERVWVFGTYVREVEKLDLPAQVAALRALVADPARFNAGNAAQLMNAEFQALDALDPADVNYASVDRDHDQLLRDLFALTLELDQKMVDFEQAGALTTEIIDGKRRAMRGLRFLRDQVYQRQAAAKVAPYAHGEPTLAHQMQQFGYQWLVNPAYSNLPLEQFPRTFFLLNVGGSTVSAAIARSTSVDTMFSHFSVGYRIESDTEIDGKTYKAGTLVTIEALIEAGVVVKPFAEHFHSSIREVVFFVRDASKQAEVDRAAKIMFDRAVKALNKGHAIGYDFSMGHKGLANVLSGQTAAGSQPGKKDLIHANNYFCAGVADAIGEEAGVDVFPHRSKLEQGSNSAELFKSWGMNPSLRVPAPGDGDVSTTLVRVAEATKVDQLSDTHLMHATLKSMFEWMDHDGYKLRQPWWFKAGSAVVGTVNAKHVNYGFVPAGIDTSIMRSFASVHKAATAYHERLAQENEAFRARTGRDMTPREAQARLLEIRDDVPQARTWFRN